MNAIYSHLPNEYLPPAAFVCILPGTPITGFSGSLSGVPWAWKEEKLWLLNVGCRASDAKGGTAKLLCGSRNGGVKPIGKISYVYVKFLYSNRLFRNHFIAYQYTQPRQSI